MQKTEIVVIQINGFRAQKYFKQNISCQLLK